ncbi:uncharacterized protein LOC120218784 [Hibiscus syriacus]|uniref:uncharacterized protein LOC120218784 n=1 Tax=Hibiscus syriacus TaxID=106335 RepID=UPI0019250099|nr:uncharacterized protein LOC120218784 [Hibiscus syriacus]
MQRVTVADMADDEGNWKWSQFKQHLPIKVNLLLTNAERKRRNLTMNIGFPLCANPVEDIDHLLRKCPSTRTWSAVVKRERLVDLLSTDMKAWITMNIPNARDFVGTIENWDILFVAIIWNIWLQRNVIALDNPLEDECPILEKSKHWVEVISKTLAKAAIRTILVQRENSNSIRWQPLPSGWIKINSN